MNGDSVDIAVAKSREVAMDATWMYIYCASLVLSCGATLLATYHMRQLGGDMLRSTVRFVILCFLLCSALHALAGALFYTFLITETRAAAAREEAAEQRAYDAITPAPAHANTSRLLAAMADGSADSADDTAVDSLLDPDHNADGGEAAFITKLTHAARPLSHVLTTFLMMENMFFLFSAYWIVLVTRELFTLAMATLDRGEASERAAIRRYVIGAGAILAAFLLAGLPIVITQKGYNRAYRFMGISELAAIVASMLFAAGSLGVLRSSGRKHEHVHGMLSRSPLYQRIKRMLVVCIVFTLPYCVLQIGLLAMSADQVDSVPDYVVGVATMLYYLFGAAQALVMGGSQQCCLRILAPIIPMHVRNSPEWANLRASRRHDSYFAGMAEATPPAQPVFVITDIEASSALWATAPPHVIDAAQQLHDDLMRASLPKFRGYEITTVGDSFQLAFHSVEDAASYALEVQLQLLHAKWPHELDGLVPATKTEWAIGLKPQAVFRGLRVRMGIHDTNMDAEGQQVSQVHPVTGKTLYIGASEFLAREVGDAGFGGQIVVSQRVAAWLRGDGETRVATPFRLDYLGAHPVEQLGLALELYELTPKVLDARRKAFRKRRGIEESRATDDDVACSAVGSALDAQAQDTESTTDESASGGDYKSQQTPTAGIRSGLATVWWRRG